MKLTANMVEKLKAGDTRREIPDGLLLGLYLLVQPSGAKSWAIRYRHHGKTFKKTVGQYPRLSLADARELARDDFKKLARGKNPADEKREEADTVGELISRFLEKHVAKQNRPKTREETTRYLTKVVLPKWGRILVTDISKRDVIALLDEIAEEHPVAANRCFAAVRKMLAWAVEKDILQTSPCIAVKRPGGKETARDRTLSDTELAAVYQAAGELGWPFGPFIQILALTGQRRNEVAGMRWSELDLRAKIWTIPKERAKTGEGHTVPLSSQAVAVLDGVPRIVESPFVFTTTGDTAISGFSKAKAEIDRMSPPKMPPWRLHDLRRTVATGLAKLGIDLPVIEKVLNHSSGSFAGVVGVYQRHRFEDEKRAALDAWAAHVVGLKRIKSAA